MGAALAVPGLAGEVVADHVRGGRGRMIELETYELVMIVAGSLWLGSMMGLFAACLCVAAGKGGDGG